MNLLVVAAHPDDEVLGFGATGYLMAGAGSKVRSCFLSGSVEARGGRPGDDDLRDHTERAQSILGFGAPIFGPFPNIQMNTVPHLDLVQFIEEALTEHSADAIVTHHPHDINDDHRQVAAAVMAAARLHQRQPDRAPALKLLLHMEIQSSTDWQFASADAPFNPDTYVECGPAAIDAKLRALAAYEGVMRPYPHPRSAEAIRALSIVRGAESGLNLAEAFVTGFKLWEPTNEAVIE
jgi:LmbE family N-acetylglucosaminyl deacetylase